MNTIIKEDIRITPMVIEHWKNKFDKSIRILLKSGCQVEELIEKLKKVALSEYEKNN
jgi:hypothetical protein